MQRVWDLIDSILNGLKTRLSAERLDRLNAKLEDLAGVGLPVAIGVILIAGMIVTQKTDDSDAIGAAVGAAIGAVVLGYLSYRCANACKTAGIGDTSMLSLSLYLDLVVLGGTLGFVGGLLGGLVQLKDGNTEAAGLMLCTAFTCLIIAWTCANPGRLGVSVDNKIGASNDLLSLIKVFVRIVLRTVVPLSSAVVIMGTALTLIAAVMAMSTDGTLEVMQANAAVAAGTSLILGGVAAPLGIYVAYVFISFPIGLYENMFAVKAIARNTAPSGGRASAALNENSSTDPGV